MSASAKAKAKAKKRGSFKLGVQDDNVLVRNQGPGREWGLDRVKELGGKVVRVNLVHGEPYEPIDELIASAAKRGIKVQLTITGQTQFAYHEQGPGGKGIGKQNKPTPKISADGATVADFGAFAKDAAQHFKGRVGRYSIWNEPNHEMFLKGRSARAYVKLYRAAQKAIKGVDPKAQVMVGELAPAKNARYFVKALAKHGIRTDGIAMHPYQAGEGSPDKPYPGGKKRFTISNIRHMKQVLRQERRGIRTKGGKAPSIYLTEFGYNFDEPNRGALLKAAVKRAKREGARQLVLYQLVSTGKQWDTGLYGPGGEDTEASIALTGKRRPSTGGAKAPAAPPALPPTPPSMVY
jgi:hypothetical protein